jgi:hypothetical protein
MVIKAFANFLGSSKQLLGQCLTIRLYYFIPHPSHSITVTVPSFVSDVNNSNSDSGLEKGI